ncbi:hypothetical protein ABZ845_12140 [Streptomyces sp. NPDC047022]|uniref:hypothetical protein n=1 Tax=Streptomyces sp. NPDC047022 TaxID=3155737 RepID=UPI0033EED44F
MTGLVRQTSSHVHIDASTVDLLGADLSTDYQPEQWAGGLIAADPSGDAVRIVCGQEIATVHITAQLWGGHPPLGAVDLETWQDIAEVSVDWQSLVLDFGTTGDGEDPSQQLVMPAPGSYRVRVSARNRDAGDPRDDSDPTEAMLIQVWQAPMEENRVIKQTSHTAQLWADE